MGVTLVELPCNWRVIKSVRSASSPPALKVLQTGEPICEKSNSIFIDFANREETELTEMRDWLVANARSKFKMFNRFRIENRTLRADKEYLGVNFRFQDSNDAFFFKLFWA